MLRKNSYKWHRISSLIIAIPVLLWAISGFMHPLMTTIRPAVSTQFIRPDSIDGSRINLSLREALERNAIESFHNFRIIHIDTNWFYQVQIKANTHPVYLSTRNGKKLKNGDALYAQHLARLFLEGTPTKSSELKETGTTNSNTADNSHNLQPSELPAATHDCCDAATACVLKNAKGTKVKRVEALSDFDAEYRSINRLLPVHKVSFDRADGIRIYVATFGNQFAYAVDDKRARFDTIFALFHNWSWMDAAGSLKYLLMTVLLLLTLVTTFLGLYLFFTTKSKKSNGHAMVKARNNHRWTAVAVSLFTILFAFSGAFHAIEKLKKDTRHLYFNNQTIATATADCKPALLREHIHQPITNISAVQMNDTLYWQITKQEKSKHVSGKQDGRKDLMKNKSVPPPNALYLKASDLSTLHDGEKTYASYLAGLFSKNNESAIRSINAITRFEGEYGFVNKRLPVWKVQYELNDKERYYIETATGKLAVRIQDRDLYEGYSFALLHKHHFMDFAGKTGRDISTMFWAMAVVVMIAFGIVLYLKTRSKRKSS